MGAAVKTYAPHIAVASSHRNGTQDTVILTAEMTPCDPSPDAWVKLSDAEAAIAAAKLSALPEPAPSNGRLKVAEAAQSQLSLSDPAPYWKACGVPYPYPKGWCGAFALWCLHVALGCRWPWRIGTGFLYRLPITKTPAIGDIAYFVKNQHHAVVVHLSGGVCTLVNGNGVGGKVTQSVCPFSSVTAFYNIEGLL